MTDRTFRMRLQARYEGPENKPSLLEVEHFLEGQWLPFDLNVGTAGFLVFVYALLHCQHTYMRLNAAERGLVLDSARGDIEVVTTEDWDATGIYLHFEGRLAAGSPGQEDIDHIVGRMKLCPVSRNVNPDLPTRVELSFSQ